VVRECFDSPGAGFSHLTFEAGLDIYARWADDVEVNHCIFNDSFQAITNWGGSNWRIHRNVIHNIITIYDEGGIGGTPIVIGARQTDGAVTARDNIVIHNMISGKILFIPMMMAQRVIFMRNVRKTHPLQGWDIRTQRR